MQASSAEDGPGQKAGSDITEADDAVKDDQYEEAFTKMKKAAGRKSRIFCYHIGVPKVYIIYICFTNLFLQFI